MTPVLGREAPRDLDVVGVRVLVVQPRTSRGRHRRRRARRRAGRSRPARTAPGATRQARRSPQRSAACRRAPRTRPGGRSALVRRQVVASEGPQQQPGRRRHQPAVPRRDCHRSDLLCSLRVLRATLVRGAACRCGIGVAGWLPCDSSTGRSPRYDLTYDDVFMVPRRSAVASRYDVDLATARRHRHDDPARRRQHDRRRRAPDGRDGRPARRPRGDPAGHPARRRRRRRRLGEAAAPGLRHRRSRWRPTDTVARRARAAAQAGPRRGVVVVEDGTPGRASSPRPTAPASTGSPRSRDVMSRRRCSRCPRGRSTRARRSTRSTPPATGSPRSSTATARCVGILTRTGALRATLYAPAVDAAGRLRVGGRDRRQRRRRGQGRDAARRRHRLLVVDTAHGHQERMLEALPGRARAVARGAGRRRQRRRGRGRARPGRGRAPTSSRSASAPAPCARPG